MARREDDEFDFLGLYIENENGKENKSNGAIKLKENALYVEKRSRLNGKLKDSYEISYDDLFSDGIERTALNRLAIQLKDKQISLKTLDHDMLDKFEERLYDIIEGPQEIAQENLGPSVSKTDFANRTEDKISEIDIPDQIRKYHDLYNEGIITEEEFEKKKKDLLSL